jgi:hypothetical protein
MMRISLDALDEYSSKENRNPLLIEGKELEKIEKEMFNQLEKRNYNESKKKLDEYMKLVGERLVKFGIPRAHMKKKNNFN